MKTQKSNSLRGIVKTAFLILLTTAAACQPKSADKPKGTSVAAPEMDIHTAVFTNNVAAVKQHVAAGSDLNQKDQYGGSSPLISASLFGKTEIAKILIDAGADINFQNNDGSTALLTSSFFCRPEIVKMLLKKGADKAIKNKYGSTAYASVAGSFPEAKPAYDMMGKMLESTGLRLDYAYIEKTRPEIAAMLR